MEGIVNPCLQCGRDLGYTVEFLCAKHKERARGRGFDTGTPSAYLKGLRVAREEANG